MKPKWLNKESNRKRSIRQENKLAKKIGGKATPNSGATLRQNDVVSNEYEIEAKFTANKQFTLKLDELQKLQNRCRTDKIPVFVIEIGGEEYAILKSSVLW